MMIALPSIYPLELPNTCQMMQICVGARELVLYNVSQRFLCGVVRLDLALPIRIQILDRGGLQGLKLDISMTC